MKKDKKNIIWIASYPKSGNTWMRIFLANYLNNTDEPIDINQLNHFPIASSRLIFEEATGMSSSDLLDDEVDRLRPEVYKYFSSYSEKDIFFKIHDIYTKDSESSIPIENTKSILYIIRNPLDVVVSFSRHMNVDIDEAIRRMNNENFSFCNNADKLVLQFRQKIRSWSGHIESWTAVSDIPIKIIRFEDMLSNNELTFKECIEFLEIPFNKEKFELALSYSEFSKVKKQEQATGFRERPFKQESFFWKGKSGNWKSHLTDKQVQIIVKKHKEMMKIYSYIDENDLPK